jgi:cobalt-precorrin-5B (C1)-methyltransferase
MARSGYTLPVFAVAAAKAALIYLGSLNSDTPEASSSANRPNPTNNPTNNPTTIPATKSSINIENIEIDILPEIVTIPISQIAILDAQSALAITLSDPGDNLDLTRNTPIWAWVKLSPRQSQAQVLILEAGEGLGKTTAGDPAIYSYARRLFDANLLPIIPPDKTLTVSIILPEGRQLAQRTSNEAFGVLEGLSLLGTSGISQPLSASDHLEEFRQQLQTKVKNSPNLVFCIGANGMQVAQRLVIPESSIVQTGNWIGALLVEAGLNNANSILLLGYQGKLIKLAGGIFNTSSHLADGKLEIISAAVITSSGNLEVAQTVLNAKTADAAYKILVEMGLDKLVFGLLAEKISHKAQSYIQKYANKTLKINTILFNRQGEIIAQDN